MGRKPHPRTGEKRKTRQPFLIDSLPQEVRDQILVRRASGHTWQRIAEASADFAGRAISISVLQRWYDVQVEQKNAEVLSQAIRSEKFAAAFVGKGFKDMPEATMNALASQVFDVMEKQGQSGFEDSLGNLAIALSKMITAQARARMADMEVEKVGLAKKKFEELKSKADKVTNEAATKLGKGQPITAADIDRIRERAFGLGPAKRSAAAGHPA